MHNNFPTKFYFINSFKKNNIDKLNNNTGVIFRNYKNSINLKEINHIKNYCRNKNIKFFLSNHFKLAVKLNLDGAYIPSFNKDFCHLAYKMKSSFLIIGSAHNINEIRIKEKQKVRLIFLSSIFKKNKNYLGLYKFKYLKKLTKKEIVPLGGITKKNIKILNLLDCKKFSGISYFE
tara:strand:- start:94 stop:621 length:528 start_codon:yes stop_codon:yes gene_type:complete